MKKITLLMSLCLGFLIVNVDAQTVLFSEDFEDGDAYSRWTFVESGGTNVLTTDFDYVNAGIAAAPNGGGLGLKYEVNTVEEGQESHYYGFPNDQTFSGNYTLTFDLWMNYEGTTGTTEFSYVGVGHANTDVPSSDGYDFTVSPDNGAARDLRIYMNGEEMDALDIVLANPTSQNQDDEPYKSSFEGDVPGNQWLEITVDVTTDTITYMVNGDFWSKVGASDISGNIMIGYIDLFGSVAPETSFAVYDNIKVTTDDVNVKEKAQLSVKVFPNPANNVLNIEVNERANVELINSLGQMVVNKVVDGNATLDVSQLNSGVYFTKITNDEGLIKTEKVIIK